MGEPRETVKLAIVDTETGELRAPDCEQCRVLADQLAGAEKERRRLIAENQQLLRDVEADAREHPLWDEARAVFDYWKAECRHPKARFNAERFKLILPFLEKDGASACRQAINGAAFDPFVTTRKNKKAKRHDSVGLVFRDREHFEDFCERAPARVEPDELRALAASILSRMPEDERPTEDRIFEAVREAQATLRGR